jgi:hypothetical protein
LWCAFAYDNFADSNFKQPNTVIASEAKQSIEQQERKVDCFASLAMTARYESAISPRKPREVCQCTSSKIRGRRECRALDAPAASRAEKGRKHTSVVTTVTPEITQHSLRNGFNKLLRALPGEPGLFATVASGYRFRQLDTSVGVSGPHDFTVRETAPFVSALPRVHRIPPRVRDDREPPL